jgi:thymidylate kinase
MRVKGFTLWFTRLSGSGKSTFARAVETKLKERNYLVIVWTSHASYQKSIIFYIESIRVFKFYW